MGNSSSFNHPLREVSGTAPWDITVASFISWQYLFSQQQTQVFYLLNKEFLGFGSDHISRNGPYYRSDIVISLYVMVTVFLRHGWEALITQRPQSWSSTTDRASYEN